MNLTGRPIYEKGQKPRKVPALRNASRGATCTLRIPGVCNGNPETVVGCHVSIPGFSAGMAQKNDDLFLIDGCSDCHACFDSRAKFAAAPVDWLDVLRALMESQQRRLNAGLIVVSDKPSEQSAILTVNTVKGDDK